MIKGRLLLLNEFFTNWKRVICFAVRFQQFWSKVVLSNIFGFSASILQLTIPLASVTIINEALPHKDTELLIKISLIMGFATLGIIAATYFESYFTSVFRERVSISLGIILFEHIQFQPYKFFKNNSPGYIMSRINNDASNAIDAVIHLSGISRIIGSLLGSIFLLPFFHVKLGVLVVFLIPFYIFLLVWFNQKTKSQFSLAQESAAIASKELHESLSGIYEIKTYSAEKYRKRRYAQFLISKSRALIKARTLMLLGSQVSQIIMLIGSLCVISFGGLAVISGNLSLGTLIGMNTLIAYLLSPINRLVTDSLGLQSAIAAIERIEEIEKMQREDSKTKRKSSLPKIKGYVKFENVSFTYDNGVSILQDVNLEVFPGEIILITGKSGIGKTTLMNLLLKFFQPSKGTIYFDGHDISNFSSISLRKQIAYVSQDTFLFSDSIYNNIRLGNPKAKPSDIYRAAEVANILESIKEFPESFDTKVGERGTLLSGGQRQRISIARAAIRDAPILILDEATSAIDKATEASLHKALHNLMKGRTTFIVSHHTEAFIEHVDRIFVLEEKHLKVLPAITNNKTIVTIK